MTYVDMAGLSVKLKYHSHAFLDATGYVYIRGHVRPSVGPCIPHYFQTTNLGIFECRKSANDIIDNDKMSDDKVVSSDIPSRYLLGIELNWFFL